VTAERRLAAIEAALSPTELVLAWLDEAQAPPSTYIRLAPEHTPTNGTIGRTDVTQLRSRGRPVQGHSSARLPWIDLVSTVVGQSFLRPRP
jgi:hypothetical protein